MSKSVLVTGAAGLIGRHLVAHILRETDWSIVMLDRLGEGAKPEQVAGWIHALPGARSRTRFRWHDLRAPLINEQRHFDYILHLAAGSHVDRSVRDPLGFVADNVIGTAHMLEFARACEMLGKFLHFSTDEVFGPASSRAFVEGDAFHATNPYAASKAAAEALCPAWANTYGLPIVITRCTNVVGAGQDAEKFIPGTIGKIRRGELVQIHSREGVASSRKYIDVEDVCRAVLIVLTRGGIISGRGSGAYHIAGSEEYSNVEVAQRIAAIMQADLRYELVTDPPNRPRPDMRYDLDFSRLSALGWKQQIPLDETLQRVIEWETRE